MFRDRMLDRLEEMLDAAIRGDFEERDYDETRLSRLETKWKQFLGASQCSRQNLELEKERIHRLLSDISHQTKRRYSRNRACPCFVRSGGRRINWNF